VNEWVQCLTFRLIISLIGSRPTGVGSRDHGPPSLSSSAGITFSIITFWFSKKPHLDVRLQKQFHAANITEKPQRSASQTPLGELIALPHADPLIALRGHVAVGTWK